MLVFMRRTTAWLFTLWKLLDLRCRPRLGVGRVHRGDFMHPDLPRLVIDERELRP